MRPSYRLTFSSRAYLGFCIAGAFYHRVKFGLLHCNGGSTKDKLRMLFSDWEFTIDE